MIQPSVKLSHLEIMLEEVTYCLGKAQARIRVLEQQFMQLEAQLKQNANIPVIQQHTTQGT